MDSFERIHLNTTSTGGIYPTFAAKALPLQLFDFQEAADPDDPLQADDEVPPVPTANPKPKSSKREPQFTCQYCNK